MLTLMLLALLQMIIKHWERRQRCLLGLLDITELCERLPLVPEDCRRSKAGLRR
jgi:hypothetical protein